jgi:hypothetical protein
MACESRTLALTCLLAACASSDAPIALSVTSGDSLTPQVGESVRFFVAAIRGDGSSTDVTSAADCTLSGSAPPGRLDGTVFLAEQPGTTDILCRHRGAVGSLGITVAGVRAATVAEVQRGELQEGTRVAVEAVVFALDADGDYTSFWAQDPGGGPYSGIYFRDVRTPEAGALVPAEGEVVRAVGAYLERRGRSVVNVDAIEVIGTGIPVATTLEIAALDPAIWEGCLVRVDDVEVVSTQVDAYTWAVASQGALDGPTLLVDTLLHDPPRRLGQRFGSLTGPLYAWDGTDGPSFAITPRGAHDLGAPVVSVAELHAGSVPEGAAVTLRGLVVTARDPVPEQERVDLFVQQAGGGPRSGLYLRDFLAAPAATAVGDAITVTGAYRLHRGRRVVEITSLTRTGAAPLAVDTIAVAALDEDVHQSALLRVTGVRVLDPSYDAYGWLVAEDDGAGATLIIDTLLFDWRPAPDQAFAAIAGVLYCASGGCALAPRDAADLVAP